MNNQLTEKELKFIKHYKKQHWMLLFLMVFVLIMAGAFYYIIFQNYEPNVAHLFQDNPALEKFMAKNNALYLKPSGYFLSLLVGLIIGSIYTQRKMTRIIDKLTSVDSK